MNAVLLVYFMIDHTPHIGIIIILYILLLLDILAYIYYYNKIYKHLLDEENGTFIV